VDTTEIRIFEEISAALYKLANETELIADSLAQANEREQQRDEARKEKQEREKMETDDRKSIDERRNEIRELAQQSLEAMREPNDTAGVTACALNAIALTLYAREFLK
jgi:Na+-translocating ferredoxin:NAD+ oxidoreductase RnfC subunit